MNVALVIPKKVRDFPNVAPPVLDHYRVAHRVHTFVQAAQKNRRYRDIRRVEIPMYDVNLISGHLLDGSDNDANIAQIVHQFTSTVSAVRRRPKLRPLQKLAAAIHDNGKVLMAGAADSSVEHDDGVRKSWEKLQAFPLAFRENQEDVVGDFHPVGAGFEDSIVLHEFFEANPDRHDPVLSSPLGIYDAGCGWRNMDFPLSHDTFLAERFLAYARKHNWVKKFGYSWEEIELTAYIISRHSAYCLHSPEGDREMGYEAHADNYDRTNLGEMRVISDIDRYGKPEDMPEVAGFNQFPLPMAAKLKLRALMDEHVRPIVEQHFPPDCPIEL